MRGDLSEAGRERCSGTEIIERGEKGRKEDREREDGKKTGNLELG